ncbi:glycosyltransferase [Staphylococcus chromogenes]|uniref:glycosyltransferase n=1 Tax=Staphylococcus chromogenes TaxID=46126 RepID=UPI003D7BCECF
MENIIFLTSRLDKKHGGLTASMLNKAKIFYNLKGVSSLILTFHADQYFEEIKNLIEKQYDLKDKVQIYNINNFFRMRHVNFKEKLYKVKIKNYTEVKINENKFEYYELGVKILEIYYNDNVIKEVRYFNKNNILVSKDVLDNQGYLYMKNYYFNGYISRQVFFRKDQTPFLTREFDALNNSNKINSIVLFEEEVTRFSNFNEFKKFFVELFIQKSTTYIISETRGQDSLLLEMDNPLVKKIFMTHSIHVRPGTDIIRTGNRPVLNNLNKVDALILLTNKQKNDIVRRFGYRENYHVIPHSVEIPDIYKKKQNNKVVIIARLHHEKRLDHSIKAFKNVVESVPNAILEIYGDGDEKNKLQSLITKLDLNKNVKLKGFTKNVNEVLQTAEFTLNTSYYEGFSLSIQESLANGTPVIAYDIKYGPSDMINNGVNGFLVQEGNINNLSQTMINYLKKTKIQKQQFSSNAIEKAKSFSNEHFSNAWFKLFETLDKSHQISLNPSVKLLNVKQKKFNKYIYNIFIEVKLNSKENIKPNFKVFFYHRSSLNNLENKKFDTINPKVLSSNKDIYYLQIDFHAKKFKRNDIYDLSLSIQYKTQYFDIRIGNNRSEIDINILKTKKCLPYFTEKYNNLSFKL